MFGDLNKAEIIGNITNDLQVRYTGSGSAVVSFGVATNRRYKSQNDDDWKEETTFHNVVVWGNQAEQLAKRASKGTRVFISGRLQTRSWDDADGKKNYKTEITAEDLILLDRYERGQLDSSSDNSTSSNKDNSSESPAKTSTKPADSKKSKQNDNTIDPDDLPF